MNNSKDRAGKGGLIVPKTPWILALIVVLVLLFLGHGFGAESQVHYDPKLTKDTGKCYFTSFGTKARVVCKLWLFGPDTIHFSIGKPDLFPTSCGETLKGAIIDGKFSCYYSLICKIPRRGCSTCTTVQRQELTLDKKTYRKGDVITGKIDFECLDDRPACAKNPSPVIVKGVFKTILK